MVVRWIRGKPRVLDWFADREMIQALKPVVFQTQYFVHGVIEKTAYTGPANTVGFCFQVQHLPDHSGLPEKMSVSKRLPVDNALEPGNHTQ